MSTPRTLAALAQRIRDASRLTVLTGAGVSAASGVPTFRGSSGMWRQFRPESLATPEAFARDPVLVWEWYAWRRSLVARCRPNAAHEVIAGWSRRPGCRVLTQNVDDLHVAAGTSGLVRMHGSLWELRCAAACGAPPWRDARVPLPELPPRCPRCRGLARPGVVWFGEPLDPADVAVSVEAARCDLFVAIGTSAVVYPAAGLILEAQRQGACTAEINPEATDATGRVHLAIAAPSEEALPALDRLLADDGQS